MTHRRTPKNETDDCLAGYVDAFEATQYVDFLIRQNYARSTRIFNSKLCFPYFDVRYATILGPLLVDITILACNPSDGATQVLAVESLHILDLEGLDI